MQGTVLAAILSVHYHAYAEIHGTALPPALLPLEDAAGVLRAAAGQGGRAESRRRRAIARLAAADVEQHEEVLEILGAPVVAIRNAFAQHPGFDEAHREMLVNDLLNDLGGPAVPGCEWKHLLPVVVPHVWGGATATVTVSVRQPLDRLARVMDPQNWMRCSDFFRNSYVARKEGDAYPVNTNYDAEPVSVPPPAGTRWSEMLFEHFELDWGAGVSWFRNLLWIDARPDLHRVDYRLREAIRSRVGYLEDGRGIAGGIQTDEGHTVVREGDGGWASLEAVKTISFSPRPNVSASVVDAWATVLLWAMGGEIADAVCCGRARETRGEGAEPLTARAAT